MKSTPTLLKFWLPVFLCLGVAQSVQADPTGYVDASHYVSYFQTTSGTTSLAQYGSSIGVGLNDFGNFDPATHFPTSVSFGGFPQFPGGQLDVEIPYNAPFIPSIVGSNYFGVAGGGTYGAAPFAGGYMFGVAGIWSPSLSDVQVPLSATLHGGDFDGFTQSIAPFDVDLLPTVPLLTSESLDALAHAIAGQEIALALVLPFSPGFAVRYLLSELVGASSVEVLTVDLDPVLNPSGFNIPGSLLLSGHDYRLIISQSSPPPSSSGPGFVSYQSYQTNNSVAFSVAATSVPDGGPTVVLVGIAFFCLGLVRRRH